MMTESLFASIDYRDPVWIAVAFAFGYLASVVRLPAMVGFLMAGFALNGLGAEGGAFLNEMADLGVTLLLFSIGLKLRLRQFAGAEVWGVASVHLLVTTGLFAALLMLFAFAGLGAAGALDWPVAILLGFALSFSSTVFAVKLLEEKDDMAAWYGRIAVGILIIQDIAAVIFLGISTAKVPSPLAAIVIVGIIAGRPLLLRLLERAGHGELLLLFGLVLALGGAGLFELVDMKGDLGALIFGALLAGHAKANELFKALLNLKDLLLVGFFLSIGMAGVPELSMLPMVAILALLLPIKTGLYFWLLTRFRARARAATLAAQVLSNYSEFGLIVCTIAAANGWLSPDWIVIIALSVAVSFVVAAALNARADENYATLRARLRRFETGQRLAGDEPVVFGDARVLVCGMGRVGGGAYEALAGDFGSSVVAVDLNEETVARHLAAGRNVRFGNITNPDFWARIDRDGFRLEWILLAMPTLHANLTAARLARAWGFSGKIGASAKFPDEVETLEANGVDVVFNIYAEAGRGFATHARSLFDGDTGGDTIRPG